MSFISEIPLPVILGAATVLLVVILASSLKKLVKFLLHAALGLGLLYLVNDLGAAWGVTLPMDLAHCLTAAVLGLPGVLLLLGWHFFLQ